MTKQQEYNRIKTVIDHPENKLNHLEAIIIKVETFGLKNNWCNLSLKLKTNILELELKLLKNKDGKSN